MACNLVLEHCRLTAHALFSNPAISMYIISFVQFGFFNGKIPFLPQLQHVHVRVKFIVCFISSAV